MEHRSVPKTSERGVVVYPASWDFTPPLTAADVWAGLAAMEEGYGKTLGGSLKLKGVDMRCANVTAIAVAVH